jgi:hypothetical protein
MALIEEQRNSFELTRQRFGRSFGGARTQPHAGVCEIDDGVVRVLAFFAQAAVSSDQRISR